VLLWPDRPHHAAPRRTPRGVTGPGPQAQKTILSFSGVTIRQEGVPVLAGVDWEVRGDDRWVVLGPNGSGKTTLLQVAAARLWPTAGTVEILGARLGRVDARTLRPRVALVSGAVTRQLRADLPARHVVASGRYGALETWWNTYTTEDWEKADRLLARGGVEQIGDRPFGVISEGERQQVLLARALMSDPELLLLDEPFAGLDLGARERLLVQLATLADDPGSPPIVLVTHHCEEIPPGFTHGGLVSRGALVAAGPLDDVITSERVSRCFEVQVEVGCAAGRWWSRAT
jgi:iron complex transport system ATP-binding protein